MAFSLDSISKTRRARPPKIVIGGPGKIGKTTFAAAAPSSVGILTEDGAHNVDAQAFPLCTSLDDVYKAIGVLLSEEHDFKNVFLDSLDWLEPLLYKHVCKENNWENIESPGYGRGYVAAADEWRTLLNGFEALRNDRNMGVILIAHDRIKRFDGPMHDPYDTYELKLHDRATALIKEWADVLAFANYNVLTQNVDKGFGQKDSKAKTTGERILHVEPHPAHFGGNRFGLKNMPLDWSTLETALAEIQSQ